MSVPFAWEPAPSGALGELVGSRVIQCALSRICGSCGESLGRPVAFVGTRQEIARNGFHAPPMHVVCAEELIERHGDGRLWSLVQTSGFEFVRPAREDVDRRPTFQPNSLLSSS